MVEKIGDDAEFVILASDGLWKVIFNKQNKTTFTTTNQWMCLFVFLHSKIHAFFCTHHHVHWNYCRWWQIKKQLMQSEMLRMLALQQRSLLKKHVTGKAQMISRVVVKLQWSNITQIVVYLDKWWYTLVVSLHVIAFCVQYFLFMFDETMWKGCRFGLCNQNNLYECNQVCAKISPFGNFISSHFVGSSIWAY